MGGAFSSATQVAVQLFTASVACIARVRVDLSFSRGMLRRVGLGVVGGRRLNGLIPEQRFKQLFGFFLVGVGVGSWVILRP